jgi:predicted permease
MPLVSRLRDFLRNLFFPASLDDDLDQEVRSHLEMIVAENMRTGMPAREAHRAALIELGGVEQVKEQVREERIFKRFLDTLILDLRFALRQIARSPGFALTAVLSLGLGIGATVAVFSVIYDVLVHPWPYSGADRICKIWILDESGTRSFPPSLRESDILRLGQNAVVEDYVAFNWLNFTTTGSDVPDNVYASETTGNTFLFLAVNPMFGRYILPSDTPVDQDAQPVAVLSYKFWLRHFNGDPGVIGSSIELSHKSYTIVGVMPARFGWQGPDLWLPLKMDSDPASYYQVAVKLREGVSPEAATAAFTPLYQQFDKERPDPEHFPAQFRISVRNITDFYIRSLGGTLTLLFCAVALLLAIGCGNLSILLLARGAARQYEFAVRAAVGGSRGRIVRQLLTESLLLAVAGAAVGVLLSYEAVSLIVARLPEFSFPGEADFHVHLPILIFSVGLAILTGVLSGIVPAVEISRPQIGRDIQRNSQRFAGNAHGKWMHTGLIAVQIALTLVLLSAAGAAIMGFTNMLRRPLGYDPHGVMSVGIPVARNTLPTWSERTAYFQNLLEGVSSMQGVVSAAISTNATPPSNGFLTAFDILGKNTLEGQQASINLVSPEYFGTLDIPLFEGRLWDQSEVARGAGLVIVNQAFVQLYFRNEDVIGQSVRFPKLVPEPPFALTAPGSDDWLQIIGIVRDAVNRGLDKPVAPAAYVPYTLLAPTGTQILVRTYGEPLAMLHSVRQQIARTSPGQQVGSRVDDLETWIKQEPEWARMQLFSTLFTLFSGLALVLAAVGLYSVVSYSVVVRTREFGIRMALGAQRSDILHIVTLTAGASVAIGISAGLPLSFGLDQVITRWVEDAAGGPFVVLAASLLMILAAAIACIIPAMRAISVDPMRALRSE